MYKSSNGHTIFYIFFLISKEILWAFFLFDELWWGRGFYTVQEILETTDGVVSGNP